MPKRSPIQRRKFYDSGRNDGDPMYGSMAERAFAAWARSEGWTVTKRGWPDFMCRRNGQVMAVEVKTGQDVVSADQSETIADLRAAGLPVWIWSPEHGLRLPAMASPLTDGLLAAREEIGRLQAIIRDMIGARDALDDLAAELPTHRTIAPQGERPEWALEYLARVSQRCNRMHVGHRRAGEQYSLCGWLLFLFARGKPEPEIARLAGMDVERTRRLLATAKEWAHQDLHYRASSQTAYACDMCASKIA